MLILICLVDAGICYKNSSNDGATWSKIWQVKVGATQPTVVCDGNTLILQYNVRVYAYTLPNHVPILKRMQAGTTNEQITSRDSGATWGSPTSIVLGQYGWASVGPGRGIRLESEKSLMPGRLLFIGHHGAYEVSNMTTHDHVSNHMHVM